jgi:hypothetical protein
VCVLRRADGACCLWFCWPRGVAASLNLDSHAHASPATLHTHTHTHTHPTPPQPQLQPAVADAPADQVHRHRVCHRPPEQPPHPDQRARRRQPGVVCVLWCAVCVLRVSCAVYCVLRCVVCYVLRCVLVLCRCADVCISNQPMPPSLLTPAGGHQGQEAWQRSKVQRARAGCRPRGATGGGSGEARGQAARSHTLHVHSILTPSAHTLTPSAHSVTSRC